MLLSSVLRRLWQAAICYSSHPVIALLVLRSPTTYLYCTTRGRTSTLRPPPPPPSSCFEYHQCCHIRTRMRILLQPSAQSVHEEATGGWKACTGRVHSCRGRAPILSECMTHLPSASAAHLPMIWPKCRNSAADSIWTFAALRGAEFDFA